MSGRTAAAVSVIWVIGTWLRLVSLGGMEFKADERISLELSIRLLSDHPWSSAAPWPTHGLLSSNGIGNAPLFIWIVAPLWALTHHPIGVTALIAVINALSLIPLWLWAERRMDSSRALLVLAIAAVSPFAVLYSRKIWPVDLLFPALVMLLWSLEWLREGRVWRALAVGGVGLLGITQLHQSGIISAPLLLVAIVVQWIADRRRAVVIAIYPPRWTELLAVVLVVAANVFFWWTYLPYARTIPAEVIAGRPRAPDFTPTLLVDVFSHIVPRHIRSPFFVEHDLFIADRLRWLVYSGSLALGLPLALYGIWRWLRAPLTVPVVGVWFWLVVIAFALAQLPPHKHYILAILPLPILLAAGAFDGRLPASVARALRWWRWAYVVLLLALTVLTGSWLMHRGGSPDDYGVTFEIQVAQAQRLLDLTYDRPTSTLALAEAPLDATLAARCETVSWEVFWIARWLDERASSIEHRRFEVCDGWVGQAPDLWYRWNLRRR